MKVGAGAGPETNSFGSATLSIINGHLRNLVFSTGQRSYTNEIDVTL